MISFPAGTLSSAIVHGQCNVILTGYSLAMETGALGSSSSFTLVQDLRGLIVRSQVAIIQCLLDEACFKSVDSR